ncbi:MAG: hypothetical protein WBP85_11850 [Terracidiphilus sp.]
MTRTPMATAAGLAACLGLTAGLAGCWVHVDKDANGEEKHVRVETPFGGVHVDTDQTTAVDLGLPTYPGSQMVVDNHDHQSADVHVGFGDWELRVRAVSYETPDKKDQVVAFYKKALGRYGDVITCQDNTAVGAPPRTSEGLTCEDAQHHDGVNVNAAGYHSGGGGFQLKAGSERHQHIVGFESSASGQTRFSLVALDLPTGGSDSQNKSN